jgi:metal-sulfur cluster biosynthetic enzyme
MKTPKKQPHTPEEKKILKTLETVMDPELNMSIVDLGLVYGVKIDAKGKVEITMTLTTIGCPLFGLIEQDVHNKLFSSGVKESKVTLTFDPPWSMDRMSPRARAILGI